MFKTLSEHQTMIKTLEKILGTLKICAGLSKKFLEPYDDVKDLKNKFSGPSDEVQDLRKKFGILLWC